jgi:D-glycero-alpha-D-manno-heptose-7-phosphate kinase
MIVVATPLRVSFLGGGTDYPEYFTQHGGATLGTSIDKYTYVTVSRLTEFFDHRIRVSYSKTELCRAIDEVQHPSVRECLRFMGIEGGVEINVVTDLPARTGLGSSSSFTVALLHALHAFQGKVASREQLADEAVHVEREMIRERVGVQDQYTCAIGGFLNLQMRAGAKTRIDVAPLVVDEGRVGALEQRLMLFYTGLQRTANEVLKEQIERTKAGDNSRLLQAMRDLVPSGMDVLVGGRNLSEFGELLHTTWEAKRQLSGGVSNPMIDDAYDRARGAGAVGGKLLGAGGGGFLLLYVEPYNQDSVRTALRGMREVSFSFEDHGSRIIFYRPVARRRT